MAQKRSFNEGKRHFKKNKKQKTTANEGSNEEVLLADVRHLLRDVRIADEKQEVASLPELQTEVELAVSALSSTGDGLAEKDGRVYVVPFTTPGDTVAAKVYRHCQEERYSLADFVRVITASQHRTEQPRCKYFTQCSGCQFQQLPYSYQLAHKKTIVEKAYRNFSNLSPSDLPAVGDTVGSPLQYGYRTKLTPHFDGPPSSRGDKRRGVKVAWPGVPPIGFMQKGTRSTMDIEDCPIGTAAVRSGMRRERRRVAEEINKYQKGATLLLRENTQRVSKDEHTPDTNGDDTNDVVVEHRGDHIFRKTCITDHKATSTEYIDDFRLDNPAGAFFQNNNSILPVVTQYIREHILGPASSSSSSPSSSPAHKIQNLIDAYCGSGFFTITLSSLFQQSIGIDISGQSIEFARKNAALNGLAGGQSDNIADNDNDNDKNHKARTSFLAADANALFGAVDPTLFPPAETVVVIDPPRKGCDEGFVRQLLAYGPARICYVSCNVHTQARDVGWLVRGLPGQEGEKKVEGDGKKDEEGEEEGAAKVEEMGSKMGAEGKGKEGLGDGGNRSWTGLYEIESLRGFDFFPQTSHVEGVAFLRRKERVD